MSTVGEKVSSAAGKAADFVFNPASAAQVVGRDAIAMLIDRALAVGSSDSLISATQAARVEPLVLVDTDALMVDELHDVLQSLQSIFAGYYLQAIQLDSSIGNVAVRETLGKFNPNGNMTGLGKTFSQAIGTAQHAAQVHNAGHGIGRGGLSQDHLLSAGGGLARMGQHMLATEAYRESLPDFRMIDSPTEIALEAVNNGGPRATRAGRKVDSVFDSDQDYKNWKQNREAARSSVQDQREQEDRDFQMGLRQQQANDRQTAQDLANQREADRQTDRALNFQRQMTQDDERHRKESWANHRQAHQDNVADAERAEAARKAQEEAARISTSFGNDALKDVKEASNLSVGKLLNVEIKNNGQTFQIPVAIRLIVNTIPSAQLVHTLSLSQNMIKSAKERFHSWRAGRLSFVKDLIFCRDLVDEHRRSLMKSSDSVYHNVVKREERSLAAALLGGVPSVAAASNMVVTTTNTIEEIEVSLPGKWSEFHARQKVFEATSLMIVAVIDKEWNRVSFYHRGLPDATDVSFRDIKASAKGGGPDVSDILKAYTLGNAPRL